MEVSLPAPAFACHELSGRTHSHFTTGDRNGEARGALFEPHGQADPVARDRVRRRASDSHVGRALEHQPVLQRGLNFRRALVSTVSAAFKPDCDGQKHAEALHAAESTLAGAPSRECEDAGFQLEEQALALQATAVPGEAAVGADHTMAGDDYADRVVAVRHSHGARG